MPRFGTRAALRASHALFAAVLALAACCEIPARAEFTTVINSPPDVFGNGHGSHVVGSNTQVNLFEGAVVEGGDVHLGDGRRAHDNIEFNLEGGVIERSLSTSSYRFDNTNVVVNIRGGTIGERLAADNGNVLNISGGEIVEGVGVYTGAIANISGGVMGRLISHEPGTIHLIGGDFRLNGVPIAGLATPGSTAPVSIPERGVLTGVLTDGSAIILMQQGYLGDVLSDGALQLVSAAIPVAVPKVDVVPSVAAPRTLRAGQRLELHAGGSTPTNFRATWGSTIRIDGGTIGPRLRAAGAVIDLVEGTLGGQSVLASGTVLNVSGGIVEPNLNAASGSTVNVTGGYIGGLFEALAGSRVSLAGGVVEYHFMAHEGSQVTIVGSGFRVNGVPVSGLTPIGATRQIDLPANAVLSGTYADGRPFAFSNQSDDYLAPRVLSLQSVAPPTPAPGLIHVSSSVAPIGLRTGQTMIVTDGGEVGDHFNADWGSVVNVEGGRVGKLFEATGALINITDGIIGPGFRTFYGSVANISGGTLEGYAHAGKGSVINVSGGQIDGPLYVAGSAVASMSGNAAIAAAYVHDGGTLNVSGGRIGLAPYIMTGATLDVSGGDLAGEVFIGAESVLKASGGTWGDRTSVGASAKMLITGRDFRIDGELVTELAEYNASTSITIPEGSVFSGTFQDGTPFAFSDLDGDYLGDGAVRVVSSYLAPPSPPIVDYAGFPAPTGAQGGESVFVDAQQRLGDNFVASWGSTVTMTGGAIGANFEAVGAQVLITGGEVGEGFDAFVGSEVTISGGSIGPYFTAHEGSVVNILGGQFESRMTVGEGSVVNVLGGEFENYIFHAPNSELHIFAAEFALNGNPIPGFGPGQTITLADASGLLTGEFGDGTELDAWIIRDLSWDAPVPPTALTLTWGMPGDFDNDHDVDAADLAYLRTRMGGPPSDLGGSGNDFLAWQRQLGARAAAVNHPVPEPATWTLAFAALTSLGARTPRRWPGLTNSPHR